MSSRRNTSPVETSEYSKFVRRILRGYGRRVSVADPEDLAEMLAVAAEVDTAIVAAVAGMRKDGRSWAEIAAPLNMTRQGAQQRWGKRVEAILSTSTTTTEE